MARGLDKMETQKCFPFSSIKSRWQFVKSGLSYPVAEIWKDILYILLEHFVTGFEAIELWWLFLKKKSTSNNRWQNISQDCSVILFYHFLNIYSVELWRKVEDLDI